jgi:PAS domain S-box-containing protein
LPGKSNCPSFNTVIANNNVVNMPEPPISPDQPDAFLHDVKERSDKIMNYFLIFYFSMGLVLAFFYGSWFIAIGIGGGCLVAYYLTKLLLPNSILYQYMLSTVFGVFMAQFVYQTHDMVEMHFFAFIGCAVLITYQNWKLQIPIFLIIIFDHLEVSFLQNSQDQVGFDFRTFAVHIFLTGIISFICGLWAFQLKKYSNLRLIQSIKMAEIQKEVEFDAERHKLSDEKTRILESIDDAFFAVNSDWIVTYWNNMAENVLQVSREKIIGKNLWEVFSSSIDSESYKQYHVAVATNQSVHFEDYYQELKKWYAITAYPAENGLSVFFKDVTERKLSELLLVESEKRYSNLFDLSPLPKWVFDLHTLRFLDVNKAAIENYGYSHGEFLAMTIRDISPGYGATELKAILRKTDKQNNLTSKGIFSHKKKNGDLIDVDIQSNTIEYQGSKASLAIAHDITDRLKYIKKIEKQNEALKEISWMQSHIIRAPLAKIMALIPMIQNTDYDEAEKGTALTYLAEAATELDEVIKNISQRTDIE